jgi:hypothetical protein
MTHLLQVQVADQQLLLELAAARQQVAARVEHHAPAVEDELVLAAHRVQVAEKDGAVTGPSGEHSLAELALAAVERGGSDGDNDFGASETLAAGRITGVPDILADREPDPGSGHAEDRRLRAGLEVAVLVEDAVVGKILLAIDAGQPAIAHDGGRVVDVIVLIDEAHDEGQAGAGGRDLFQGTQVVVDEALPQEQVLGRVARNGQLRKAEQVHAELAPALDVLEDLGHIALEIADRGVDLGQPHPQDAHQFRSSSQLLEVIIGSL